MEDKIEAGTSVSKTILRSLTSDNKIKEEESGDVTSTKDEQFFLIPEDRKLRFISVVLLIVNTMIGTGIFSTPANIYRAVNNVGTTFMLWLTGAVLTVSG